MIHFSKIDPVSVQNTVQTLNLLWWQQTGSPFTPIKTAALVQRWREKGCLIRIIIIMPDPQLSSDGAFYQCESSVSKQTRVWNHSQKHGRPWMFTRWPPTLCFSTVDPADVNISGADVVFAGRLSVFTYVVSPNVVQGRFPLGSYFSTYRSELKWTSSIPVPSRTSPALQKTQLLDVLLRQPRWWK